MNVEEKNSDKMFLEECLLPPISGIYFFWKGEECVYVGKSANIAERVTTSHEKFTKDMKISWRAVPENELGKCEGFYIRKLKPKLNVVVFGEFRGFDKDKEDQSMIAIREIFRGSGMTLHDLGVRMGYSPKTARMSAWQFMDKTNDPRISMLRKFSEAMGLDLSTLLKEKL